MVLILLFLRFLYLLIFEYLHPSRPRYNWCSVVHTRRHYYLSISLPHVLLSHPHRSVFCSFNQYNTRVRVSSGQCKMPLYASTERQRSRKKRDTMLRSVSFHLVLVYSHTFARLLPRWRSRMLPIPVRLFQKPRMNEGETAFRKVARTQEVRDVERQAMKQQPGGFPVCAWYH